MDQELDVSGKISARSRNRGRKTNAQSTSYDHSSSKDVEWRVPHLKAMHVYLRMAAQSEDKTDLLLIIESHAIVRFGGKLANT